MASIGIILTEEEKRAILDKYPEPPRRKPPQPKPKPALVATVSEKFAEAARTNPGNVRLSVTAKDETCLLYTSPSPRDRQKSRMPSSA